MPYSPESVSILMRFQSQVPRTIMHFTSVILIFLRCWAASRSKAAGTEVAPQAAVLRKERRFILESYYGPTRIATSVWGRMASCRRLLIGVRSFGWSILLFHRRGSQNNNEL